MKELKRKYIDKETRRVVCISAYEKELNIFCYSCTYNPLWHGYAFSENIMRREIEHLHETLTMLEFKLLIKEL